MESPRTPPRLQIFANRQPPSAPSRPPRASAFSFASAVNLGGVFDAIAADASFAVYESPEQMVPSAEPVSPSNQGDTTYEAFHNLVYGGVADDSASEMTDIDDS